MTRRVYQFQIPERQHRGVRLRIVAGESSGNNVAQDRLLGALES